MKFCFLIIQVLAPSRHSLSVTGHGLVSLSFLVGVPELITIPIDRVRTWARAKAHGPFPLSAATPRSEPRMASSSLPGTTATSGGQGPEKMDQTSGDSPETQGDEKQNMAMRFLLVVKAILFSSIVNILLVFVPVGIAVRKFGCSPGACKVTTLTNLLRLRQVARRCHIRHECHRHHTASRSPKPCY